MCLVEVEKIPKLQPSCATPASDGMVVRTQTPEALHNRQNVLEFLLLNHPLDCPVCDQSGECELQNYYMEHGTYASRFDENKTKRKKAFPIGPHVMLDQERCILCTRCVRFTQEISKSFELAVHDRGHLSEIDLFPDSELDNPYSGNVVDICPVGALTDRDFRFQCRVWFLGSTRSICPGCSRGCNIEIHFNERFNARYHDKRVQRLKPRYNPEVNSYWICDEGRYGYVKIDADTRLTKPATREGDRLLEVSWAEAISKTATALNQTLETHGPEAVALLGSPQMTNEELFRTRQLFRDFMKVGEIECQVRGKEGGRDDGFLVTADKNPNSLGAHLLKFDASGIEGLLQACTEGRIHFLYIFQHDLTGIQDASTTRELLSKVNYVVFQGSWKNETSRMADVNLPSAVYAEKEGTFTNLDGRVQRILPAVPPLGESLPDLEILARLGAALNIPFRSSLAEEVFQELAEAETPFAGMSYASIGELGQLITTDRHVD